VSVCVRLAPSEQKYKPWKFRHCEIRRPAVLSYMNKQGEAVKGQMDVSEVKLARIEVLDTADPLINRIGIQVDCKQGGYATNFRIILSWDDMLEFCLGIETVARKHNVKEFKEHLVSIREKLATATPTAASHIKPTFSITASMKPNIAARTISRVIARYDRANKKQTTVDSRVVFKSLPVYFGNDLIFGSWWFVYGSVFVVAISIAVLIARERPTLLGVDDSNLPALDFEVAWGLILLSGLFFTIGSLAFVRAMNEPAMKSLFTWYHISTDELLGSWLFLLGVAPLVPVSILSRPPLYCFLCLLHRQGMHLYVMHISSSRLTETVFIIYILAFGGPMCLYCSIRLSTTGYRSHPSGYA
jgi:hypothetical protein